MEIIQVSNSKLERELIEFVKSFYIVTKVYSMSAVYVIPSPLPFISKE